MRDRKTIDVLGLGCTAVDEILYVPNYPPADAKAEVARRERKCGGLCATALVAAARLGARCAFAGTLGTDAESAFVREQMKGEGISFRHAVVRDDAGPIRSVIVVDTQRQTRNIFYDTALARGAAPTLPSEAVIRQARVLLVDRFGIPGMIRAAKIARRAGIPVVADFESFHLPRFRELLALVDHLIVSRRFGFEFTGAKTIPGVLTRLWHPGRAVVAVTAGAEGVWYRADSSAAGQHVPAFRVRAVDTTGCGDVFHGAYAAALARGADVVERLRVASAAAALKARHRGGQDGAPTENALRRFLRGQES